MTVEIVDLSGCKRNLVVEVSTEEVEREIDGLAHKYAQSTKIPGFRPGKVPLHIIKQRFGSELRNDATQDIIQRTWKHAVEEHNLQPLSKPVVENLESKPGAGLKFAMSFAGSGHFTASAFSAPVRRTDCRSCPASTPRARFLSAEYAVP